MKKFTQYYTLNTTSFIAYKEAWAGYNTRLQGRVCIASQMQ